MTCIERGQGESTAQETSEPTEDAEEAPGPAPESPDAVMMAAPAADSVPSQSDSKESAQEPGRPKSDIAKNPARYGRGPYKLCVLKEIT